MTNSFALLADSIAQNGVLPVVDKTTMPECRGRGGTSGRVYADYFLQTCLAEGNRIMNDARATADHTPKGMA